MHLAVRFDVVVQLYDTGFIGVSTARDFVQRPGKVVAVVIE